MNTPGKRPFRSNSNRPSGKGIPAQKHSAIKTPLKPQAPISRTTPSGQTTAGKTNKKLRLGFLNWSSVKDYSATYFGNLYKFLEERMTRGEVELVHLCPPNYTLPFPSLNEVKAAGLDAAITNGIWNHDFLGELARLNIPIVSCDHDAAGTPFDSVIFDGIQGGVMIGKLLLKLNHTDILFITRLRRDVSAVTGANPLIEDPTHCERRTGVQQALIGSKAEFWPIATLFPGKHVETYPKLRASIERLVADMGRWPTAVVTPDMSLSSQLSKVLQELGLSVPEHVSMITFHAKKYQEAPEMKSNLTSCVEYDYSTMAVHAWELLQSRLAGMQGPGGRVTIPPTYVDHGTVGPRRKG